MLIELLVSEMTAIYSGREEMDKKFAEFNQIGYEASCLNERFREEAIQKSKNRFITG